MMFYSIKERICGRNLLFLLIESLFIVMAMNIANIYEAMNGKV